MLRLTVSPEEYLMINDNVKIVFLGGTKTLEEINERGTTVVVVTHNLDIVKAMKKRVITMRKGVVISDEDLGGTNEI